MSRKWRSALVVAVPLVIFFVVQFAMLRLRIHPLVEVADTADKLHLKLIAESIYEYQAMKGRWPCCAEDLQETSLPLKAPYDVGLVKNGPFVVVWPQDLDMDPKKNGRRLLVYTLGGPARDGWVWVCWGDLRTEYMNGDQFQAVLRAGDE
jgi:hypothetical protein